MKNILILLLVLESLFAASPAKAFNNLFDFSSSSGPHWRPPQKPIKAPKKSPIIVTGDSDYEQCKAQVMPSFINISMGWGNGSESVYSSYKSLSPPAVIVTSAGNDYQKDGQPAIPHTKARASREFNAIVVGSLNPNGHKSYFSQAGPSLHIMAPSHHEITSAYDDGSYFKFGGTSGAAPLVTGSLAGFERLAGYHPTAEESKILLEKTAVPTVHSNDNPPLNGVGMVNAYKLGMVGKRLKKQCGQNPDCFKQAIRADSSYTFSLEDPKLEGSFDMAFPECSREPCHVSCSGSSCSANSCKDKTEVFKKIRKAAFLNPRNKELWRKIACVYADAGFKKDSEGVLSIYNALNQKSFSKAVSNERYCQTDADCTVVSSCKNKKSKAVNKQAAELQYIRCTQAGLYPRCAQAVGTPAKKDQDKSHNINIQPSRMQPNNKQASLPAGEAAAPAPLTAVLAPPAVKCVDFVCTSTPALLPAQGSLPKPLIKPYPPPQKKSGSVQ